MGACSERVDIIPNLWRGANFAEDMNMIEHVMSSFLVAGAGNRKVAMFGTLGECRCDTGIDVSAAVVLRGWGCKTAWQGCRMYCP